MKQLIRRAGIIPGYYNLINWLCQLTGFPAGGYIPEYVRQLANNHQRSLLTTVWCPGKMTLAGKVVLLGNASKCVPLGLPRENNVIQLTKAFPYAPFY